MQIKNKQLKGFLPVSTNLVLQHTHNLILQNGGVTITLPEASNQDFFAVLRDSGQVTEVTFSAPAGYTIEGSTSYTTRNTSDSWVFALVGTDWNVVETASVRAPYAAGSMLAANSCVNQVILVPSGNTKDVKTVGTGGDFADWNTALANAAVTTGTILRAVSNTVVETTVNVNKSVVIDLGGYQVDTLSTGPTTVFNLTAPLSVLRDGIIEHDKTTNTSVEAVVNLNVPSGGPAFVVNTTMRVQEFAITARGQYVISDNAFEYLGASQTNSHRYIAVYGNSGESRIHNNTFTCITASGTRYSNFILMSLLSSTFSGKLYVTNNKQVGGDLRQFFLHEAGDAGGMELYVANNEFDDLNGGIGIISPALYNSYSKIGIFDNRQGGSGAANYKGIFFVDGSGALSSAVDFKYGGNTSLATTLRAGYTPMVTDTNLVARNVTVTQTSLINPPTLSDNLDNLGDLLQDLKSKWTYIVDGSGNPISGTGTKTDPYVISKDPSGQAFIDTIDPNIAGTKFYTSYNLAKEDSSLAARVGIQYIASDGTEWVWNGTDEYVLISQVLKTKVKNPTASTLSAFKAVYISGASGSVPEVSYASNASEATSSKTLGLVQRNITGNTTGIVVEAGLMRGDTSLWPAGTSLWLGTNGDLTSTKPVAPAHAVYMGVVIDQGPVGRFFVKVQNGYELGELHDVDTTGAITGNGLVLNGSGVWKPGMPSYTTTSLIPSTNLLAPAQANTEANIASVLKLSDNSYVSTGKVIWPAHGLTVGAWYYTSQATPGAYVTPAPTTGIAQELFFVQDTDTIHVSVQDLDRTPFMLQGGTTDAGSNKSSAIYRTGPILIATDASTQQTSVFPFHLQSGGGLSGITTRIANVLLSGNTGSGFAMEATGSATGERVSAWRASNGVTRLSAYNDTGTAATFTNPIAMKHSTGFIGFNTDAPNSRVDVVGSLGANVRFSPLGTTLTASDYTLEISGTTSATLPAADSTTNRRIYNIKNVGTGVVTVVGNIDSVTSGSITLRAGQVATLQSDGGTWLNLSKPVGPTGLVTDESVVAVAGLTAFTLTATPYGAVAMFRNGMRLPKAAISVSGTSVTYVPANNGNNQLVIGDRITFDYVA